MQRKRISIRIEHTEVTLTITEASTLGAVLRSKATEEPAPPRQCPSCGSPWLPDFRDVLGTLRLTAAQLKLAASEGRLHLFCSSGNEVWVCERSVREMTGGLLPPQRFAGTPIGGTEDVR